MNSLTDTELRLIERVRSLQLFDFLTIKYAKQGELMWELTTKERGTYRVPVNNLPVDE